jgi:hypothetical protein
MQRIRERNCGGRINGDWSDTVRRVVVILKDARVVDESANDLPGRLADGADLKGSESRRWPRAARSRVP